MKIFFIFTFCLLLCACKTQKVGFVEINFEADACFGTCPIFTMTIKADGTAYYHAEIHNEREGEFSTVIKPLQLDSLKKLIEKSELLSLKNEYSTDWTDLPTYTLTVKLSNGQTKTIKDYGPSGPGNLKKLYHLIFSLRKTQNWK